MALLCIEGLLCHKHGEVGILHPCLLNFAIKPALNALPDVVRARAQNVAPFQQKIMISKGSMRLKCCRLLLA